MIRILVVIAIVVVVLLVLVAVAWAQVGPILKPSLDQPFIFPHNIHVAVAQLECQFCHRSTDQVSPATAGYPSVEQCMFCHKIIATDRPRIQQLTAAAQSNKPIDWVRVYLLPDHVHFVHEPHIRAGFDCATCHGNVVAMEQVRQVRDLKMADCMNCHRANNARTDCSVCHY